MKLAQVDRRFQVHHGRFGEGSNRTRHVFAHSLDPSPAHMADWEEVPGTSVLLIGPVQDPLRLFLGEYKNEELEKKWGIHPTTAAKLRAYLKVRGRSDHPLPKR